MGAFSMLSALKAFVRNSWENNHYRVSHSDANVLLEWIRCSSRAQSFHQVRDLIESQVIDKISRRDLANMLYGLIEYQKSGLTPSFSHQAFIRAFEQTSGLAQELFHAGLFPHFAGDKGETIKSTFFGEVPGSDVANCIAALSKYGYVDLGRSLSSASVCELLRRISLIRFSPRGEENWNFLDPKVPPICSVADASVLDLRRDSMIAELARDPLLLNIASQYLNTKVTPINYCLWYTFPSAEPTSESAQLFHYDLDTLRWLKVFIFLTDVDTHNGPHEYVEGSHLPGAKPSEILRRNYARISDLEIDKYFAGRRRTLVARRGSVVLADTRCFHKGNNPTSGYRLVLQPIYAPSRLSYSQY